MINMKFNEMVIKEIYPLLSEYGFKISYQSDNIVNFESLLCNISLAHNSRENSNTFWLGSVNSNEFIEIDDQVIKDFFNCDIEVNNLSIEKFINNIFLFLRATREKILMSKESFIVELEKFDQLRSDIYTDKLLKKQNLNIIDDAWKKKDYNQLIKSIDEIGLNEIPKSYQLKYKIAKHHT